MSLERLPARDKRSLLILILLAVVAAVYTWQNFSAAFPQASIELRYSKEEITRRAAAFLASRDLEPEGLRNLTLFDPDMRASMYLERELGLEEANRLMREEVSVWRWRARWFRPPEKEERIVYLSPQGEVTGFAHIVPEEQPGDRLDQPAALAIAEQFLAQRSSDPHRLIEASTQDRPARLDHTFTWEREGFRARDATYRRTIVVQGGAVGHYSEYLYIPEQWQRDFASLRSRNLLWAGVAQAFFVPLILAAVIVVLLELRRGQVRWRTASKVAAVVAVLMMVSEWNTLPFFIDAMPTSSEFHQTVLLGLLEGIGVGVGTFFYILVAGAAGEVLYRRMFREKLSLGALASRRALGTREFFVSTVTGYAFAGIHIGFVVAFYLAGSRFGVWSPQDIPYSDLLSTALPWLYPLSISSFASVSEEFWFRLLAIPLLLKLTRSRWVAILVPAFVWGFLHANYPQQPAYIRGVEVGLIGVAAGYLMLRFGIAATVIWHYVVDAILIGIFLFQADSLYFRLSGVFVAAVLLVPFAVSAILYRRQGGFAAQEDLLNEAEGGAPAPAPAPVEPAPVEPAAAPPWRIRWVYLAALVAAAVALLAWPVTYGDFLDVKIPAERAVEAAAAELDRRGADPASWRSVAQFVPGLSVADFEYLRQQAGPAEANRIVAEHTDPGVWGVRFFRPLEKEEYRVRVAQDGSIVRVSHLLDEKAPGATLSLEEARQIAERDLRERGIGLTCCRLVDSSTENRENRADHDFVWERTDFSAGEATARLSVSVLGDEPSDFTRYLKLPEAWLRDFSRPRLAQYVVPGLLGGLAVPLLVVVIRRLGSHEHVFHWKVYISAGVACAAISALGQINVWPAVLAGYPTATPLENYLTQVLLGRLTMVLLLGFAGFAGVLAVDVFVQMRTGGRVLPPPSLARAAAIAILAGGFLRASRGLEDLLPGPRLSLPLWSLPGADSVLPAFTVLGSAFYSALLALAAVVGFAASVRLVPGRRRLVFILGLVLMAAFGQALDPIQFAYRALYFLAAVALLLLVWRTCGADLLSFLVGAFWLLAAEGAVRLMIQSEPGLSLNGGIAAAVALAAGLVAIWRGRRVLPAPAAAAPEAP